MLGYDSGRRASRFWTGNAAVKVLSFLTVAFLATLPAWASPVMQASSCAALTKLQLPNTEIESATFEEAGGFNTLAGLTPAPANPPHANSLPTTEPSAKPATTAPSRSSIELPAHCRVKIAIKGSIKVEVWLPADHWNGRFEGVGNGGTAGFISYTAMAAALHRGYAVAGTDTGHVNRLPNLSFDATWAQDRPDLVDDWAYLAIHLMTTTSQTVVKAFYSAPPSHSYFVGCSRGGAQALMEAQRFPDDYDGIIAGDPANDSTGLYTGSHLWYAVATLKDPESYIPAERVHVLADAVNRQCDELDGVKDGILNDPRKCKVDLNPITCKQDQPKDECLTSKQVQAVQAIWNGVRDTSGKLVFPGLVPGGEAGPMGWAQWITGHAPRSALHYQAADQFFKYIVYNNPDYDPFSFNFGSDWDSERNKLHAKLDAVDPDLRPFFKKGGKLILYHGWSDPDISPLNTIHYYTEVQSTVGAHAADSVRLFMVPGMQHCENGPGATHFDAVTSLQEWRESGMAPSQMLAFHLDGTAVDLTRPLCPYPQVAVFSGKGSPSNALNFACKNPK
jgi:feruloyl esterase